MTINATFDNTLFHDTCLTLTVYKVNVDTEKKGRQCLDLYIIANSSLFSMLARSIGVIESRSKTI